MISLLSNCKSTKSTTTAPVTKAVEPYEPTEANVKDGVTLAQLQQGRILYTNVCGKCHKLPKATKYAPGQWTKTVQVMQDKDHFSDNDKALILKYLDARI